MQLRQSHAPRTQVWPSISNARSYNFDILKIISTQLLQSTVKSETVLTRQQPSDLVCCLFDFCLVALIVALAFLCIYNLIFCTLRDFQFGIFLPASWISNTTIIQGRFLTSRLGSLKPSNMALIVQHIFFAFSTSSFAHWETFNLVFFTSILNLKYYVRFLTSRLGSLKPSISALIKRRA